MAAIDPYAPCPCGSGQKFKWCCQKMEAFADRAERLYEGNQVDAAIAALDDGLRKEPANAWLLTRKAIYQVREGRAEDAKTTLRALLARQPQHVGGHSLLVRSILETEGPIAGLDQLQHALTILSEQARPSLGSMTGITGSLMARIGQYPSALALIRLAAPWARTEAEVRRLESVEQSILGSMAVTPWLKTTYRLSPPPDGLAPARAARFAEAVSWAEAGLWASAAAVFESLSAEDKSPATDRNLGLCRLWLADSALASEALDRAIRKMGETIEAVDLEALRQLISPTRADDKVDEVQLIWPLRDREGLLARLRAQADVGEEESGTIDPNDPESPPADRFTLLDRPALPPGNHTDILVTDVPLVVGRLAVGREIVGLEGFDSGGLDALSARFTALAASTIPPAHPRTKILGSYSRAHLALTWDSQIPQGTEDGVVERILEEGRAHLILNVWPRTPMPVLGGRTPEAAARAGDAAVPLRAALCIFERQADVSSTPIDIASLRSSLGIAPEPEVDPETVEIDALSIARLPYVEADRLSDEKLLDFYGILRAYGLRGPIESAARALAARPALIESGAIASIAIYSELATGSAARGDVPEALRLIEQGRRAEASTDRQRTAPTWDMLAIGLRAGVEPPEAWVPELAIVIERYRADQTATQSIMLALMEMGLIRTVPNPDNPQDMMIDPRPLQALLAEFGPRVTTSSGQLGVSATRGGIWTPGGESTGSGVPADAGIWTPGSSTARPPGGGADKPRLIIPGR